jgi:hypothetical protein
MKTEDAAALLFDLHRLGADIANRLRGALAARQETIVAEDIGTRFADVNARIQDARSGQDPT